MSAICLFGALCSVSQDLFISNRYPVGVSDGLDLIVQNSFQQHSSETRIPINSPSQSPCPSVFRYIQDNGEWKGEVTLENVDSRRDTNLRVEITINHILHDVSINSKPIRILRVRLEHFFFFDENDFKLNPENTQNLKLILEIFIN